MTAIVSDKVGCAPDLIIPGKTGEVFPCGNVKRLAAILKRAALEHQSLKEMGDNALKLIEDYSVYRAAEGTSRALKAVVKGR